jgi:hypothetical protein
MILLIQGDDRMALCYVNPPVTVVSSSVCSLLLPPPIDLLGISRSQRATVICNNSADITPHIERGIMEYHFLCI